MPGASDAKTTRPLQPARRKRLSVIPHRPHQPHGRPAPMRACVRLAAVAMLSLACLSASPASAQEEPEAPRSHVIVTAEQAPLRSKGFDRAYPIARREKGSGLRVAGDVSEEQRWFRVHYPQDVSAFVRADSAEPTEDGDGVTLSRDTRLRAPHAEQGLRGSWGSALPEPLEAGTRLELRSTLRRDDGTVEGYEVRVPEGARAFIHRRHVRWAGPDETARLARDEAEDSDERQAGARDERGDSEGRDGGGTLATPEPDSGAESSGNGSDDPMEPMAPPEGDQPERSGGGADGDSDAGSGDGDPVVIDQGSEDGASSETGGEGDDAEPLSLGELEAKYRSLKDEPLRDAEWRPLLGEHERALRALEDEPFSERLRRQLRARIELINARIKLQERVLDPLRNDEGAEPIERIDPEEVRERVSRIRSRVGYEFIGRLTSSSLYDGQRLPRLYRLRGLTGARETIGYIRPGGGLELGALLGRTVGIVGSIDEDTDLPVRLIEAERVERVEADKAGDE